MYPEEEMKSTHVLLVTDTNEEIWPQVIEFTRSLSRLGVEVSLAPVGQLTHDQRAEISRMHSAELFELTFGCAAKNVFWETASWLLSLEQRVQPDIVHLFEPCYGVLEWHKPVVVTMDTCELSRAIAVEGRDITSDLPRYWKAIARGLHAAELVVTPSEDFLRRISHIYGRPKRSHVIHHGREATPYIETDKRELVLSTGEWNNKAHNLRLFDGIAPVCTWPVYLAAIDGVGPDSRPLSSVRIAGPTNAPDLAIWYSRAAIFAHAGIHDSTGMMPLDAAAAGCALVLTDIPVYKEIWGEAAVYAAPNDPASFAAAINALISSPWRREKLAASARVKAAEYSALRMARDYMEAYAELLATRRDAAIHQMASIA